MRFKRKVLSLALVVVLQPINFLDSSQFAQSIYLQQKSSNSCTLCASAMMIRSGLQKNGVDDWNSVAEEKLKDCAWTEQGLSWQWEWTGNGNIVSVGHESLSGICEEKLKTILRAHPEGIVLYCGGDIHHAVFITDWTDSVIYCADPAVGYAGKRIPIDQSLLGERIGDQEQILCCVSAYWYIDSIETEEFKADFLL